MTDSHVCNIPSFLYEDLMLLFTKWMTTGAIGSESLQDVIEAWTSTKAGKDLEAKLDGKFFWLIRLDQMSPKDSTLVRNGPISSFSDLVLKICSSMRAHGCFQHAKKDADDIGGNVTMQLILNPWDPEMDPAKEFRVFVPPPAARGILEPHVDDFKMSAIRQYRWHHPFSAPFDLTVPEAVACVTEGTQQTLVELISYTATEMDAGMRKMVLKYGFSFDIVLKKRRKRAAGGNQSIWCDEWLWRMLVQLGFGQEDAVWIGESGFCGHADVLA